MNPQVSLAVLVALGMLACAPAATSLAESRALPRRLPAADIRAAGAVVGCYDVTITWNVAPGAGAGPAVPPRIELQNRLDTAYAGALQYIEVLRVQPSSLATWNSLSTWRASADSLWLESNTRASWLRAALAATADGFAGRIAFVMDLGPRSGDGVIALQRRSCERVPDAA